MSTRLTDLESRAMQERTLEEREATIGEYRKQYFDAYPTHNDPIIQPIIQQQAAQMAQEFPHLPWNKDYVAALGTRVNAAWQRWHRQPRFPLRPRRQLPRLERSLRLCSRPGHRGEEALPTK